jgi:hypothetical protein
MGGGLLITASSSEAFSKIGHDTPKDEETYDDTGRF